MATQQPPVQPLLRPYKYYYTPFLHGKFVRVVAASSIVCYLEAALLGDWGDVWNWTPFSATPIRAFLVLIATLALLIIRVSTLHFGKRTTATRFGTGVSALLDIKTYEALFWYTFSSWFFCEVYIWSHAADAKLGLVDTGRTYEPDRFNERPVFLRTSMIVAGIVQTGVHIWFDLSGIPIALPSSSSSAAAPPQQQQPDAAPSASELLNKFTTYLMPVMLDATLRASMTSFGVPLIYFIFLRHVAWRVSMSFYGNFITIPKKSRLSVVPIGIIDLVARLWFMAFLLFTLWGVTNAVFTTLLAAEPLKKGKPLTDRSKDPNGSLLAGLKAKKVTIKTASLRELYLIIERFSPRRQMIYKDVDRKEGSAFSQVLDVVLGELHIVTKRIQDYQSPKAAADNTAADAALRAQQDIKSLPHIAQPLKKEPIFKSLPAPASTTESVESAFGKFARSRGSHPGQPHPISPRARKLLAKGAEAVLSKEQQQLLTPSGLEQFAGGYVKQLMGSPAGWPFRVRQAKQIDGVAVAEAISPYGYSRAHIVILGVACLTKLVSWSIKEDQLGIVAASIPAVFKTYTSTAKAIEDFLGSQPPPPTSSEDLCDTVLVLAALQQALETVINEFGEYRAELGIRADEWKAAKELVARHSLLPKPFTEAVKGPTIVNGGLEARPEMQQVR